MENPMDRRRFVRRTTQVIAGGLLGGALLKAQASDSPAPGGSEFYEIDAATEGRCATCQFWGGVRRIAKDRKKVLVQSLGWCNNPQSHHYQRLTTPETGPMESWMKWGVLS